MNIFVGNLSLAVTEAELRQEFLAFGQVSSVSIMSDGYIGSGQPRGYGFVEMPFRRESEAAIGALNGKTFGGRPLTVIEALPLTSRPGVGPAGFTGSDVFHKRARQRA